MQTNNLCPLCLSTDTPTHRHTIGDWIFPSATQPGTYHSTTVGLGPHGDAWSCTCPLGADPRTARICWHALAATTFHQYRLTPSHTLLYTEACNGDLASQLTILSDALDAAINRHDLYTARLLSRAFSRLLAAYLLDPPPPPTPISPLFDTHQPAPAICPVCRGETVLGAFTCTTCSGGGLVYWPITQLDDYIRSEQYTGGAA